MRCSLGEQWLCRSSARRINLLMRYGDVENRSLFSQVFRFKTCHLGEAGQHTWTNLVAIMKREDDIGPSSPL